jgi:S1-C subfamily serine protease
VASVSLDKKTIMTLKNVVRGAVLVAGIMLLGGIGSLIIDRSILPWLSAQNGLSHFEFLKRAADNVTIVNKTEQITVREDDSLENIVSQPATAVVTLVTHLPGTAERTGGEGDVASGVLLTNDGIIATYRSSDIPKIEGQTFSVILFDGSVEEARFIGWDSLTNIAFFRIEVSDAPAIALADSDSARLGKKLIAIAHGDEARQNRFLTGTLDAFDATFNLSGKTVASTEKWEGVFRMNTPLGVDFVGSPVIQYNGEMLGIIGTLVIDNAPETFIIPAKAIRQSLDFVLSEEGKNGRPSLGVYYLPLTKSVALLRGIARDQGALVYSSSGRTGLALIAGSPAEKAGLRVNDIIVAVAGEPITLTTPLPVALMKFKRGETFALTVLRDGTEQELLVTL